MGKIRIDIVHIFIVVFTIAAMSCFCNCTTLGHLCSDVRVVQVNYKNYESLYLGDGLLGGGLMQNGLFVRMLKFAVPRCCPNASLIIDSVGEVEEEIQELVLSTLKASRTGQRNGVHKLYFPEFAPKKILTVYDAKVPFVVLSRSPGPALIMLRPAEKKPVFVGEIFVKSWAIMTFLLTCAWIIGIVVWFTDHNFNAQDFPNPFYVGMMQGFWWSVITMTGVGYGDKTTKGPFGRIMAVLWIMISTIFVSLFTANASSILAISQAEEDHSITLGKKIGSFNSKHFFEDQLNLGGQMINHPTGMSMRLSILNGDTDRAIFPNYLDFIHALTLPEFSSMKDVYQISNTFDYPFQIGMAFAVDPNNMTSSELGLLTCLRSSLPPLELLLRRQINVVGLHDESISKKKKVPLDSNTILTLSYWCFLIIACLVAFGLSYDYWNYRRRNHTSEHHIGDIEESVIEGTNDEINVQQPDVENQENVQPDVENQENVQPDVENQENVQLYCAESSQSVKQEAVDCCENNVTVNDETDVPQDSNYSLHE